MLVFYFVIGTLLAVVTTDVCAQFSASEAYQRNYQNRTGVADSAAERLLGQRQAIRAGYDVQALESPVNPASYILGPGDGVYLNVYAAHVLDQDLTVTPEGQLLLPGIGQVDVSGLTVNQAQTAVNTLLEKVYKTPHASLSLRKVRPIKVNILGEVVMPGVQTAVALERLSEVIDKSGGFKAGSSIRNIEIRNLDGSLRQRVDLTRYFALGDLSANPIVQSGDVIVVPHVEHTITLVGSVEGPGQMELHDGDSLSTVIRLARGLLPSAQADSVEITRFSKQNPSQSHRFYVNYQKGQDSLLQDGDYIFIRYAPQYHAPHIVSIAGEVFYPGRYSIDPGQTRLSDVLKQGGGFLPTASLDESILIRRVGTGSWESDPEFMRLQTSLNLSHEKLTDEEYNYFSARLRMTGRAVMVVDFKKLVQNNDRSQDILLREEDSIWVPRARGFVTVSGSVNNQGDVSMIDGGTYEDYIYKAGGFTAQADKSGVRVINSRSGSYIDPRSDRNYVIGPGDTIVVPIERNEFWKNFGMVTAIVAQLITIIAGVYVLVKR